MVLLAGATLLPCLAGKPSLPLLSPPTTRRTHARRGISSRTKKALSTVVPPAPSKEEAYKDSNLDETESGLDGVDNGYVLPELPGEEPDFWEGPRWDALGFFVQYMWAFGIVFVLIACGIAVATYNGGATDFKQTPVYKESIQSRDLLDEPEGTNADVFEGNPTEVAPSVELILLLEKP